MKIPSFLFGSKAWFIKKLPENKTKAFPKSLKLKELRELSHQIHLTNHKDKIK